MTKKNLNPLSNYTREQAFIRILESEEFDLVIDLASGSEDVLIPDLSKSLFEKYSEIYTNNRTPGKYKCDGNIDVVHKNLIDLIYERYNTPILSLGLSCCKMPLENDIAWAWRNDLHGIMKLIEMANTGKMFCIIKFFKS